MIFFFYGLVPHVGRVHPNPQFIPKTANTYTPLSSNKNTDEIGGAKPFYEARTLCATSPELVTV